MYVRSPVDPAIRYGIYSSVEHSSLPCQIVWVAGLHESPERPSEGRVPEVGVCLMTGDVEGAREWYETQASASEVLSRALTLKF